MEPSADRRMTRPILKLNNIRQIFHVAGKKQPTIALDSITCSINPGEFFVFLGPSGAGKSTILRIMAGLEKPHRGEVAWGNDTTHLDSNFVFQQFALLPWLTVADNVELAILSRESNAAIRRKLVMKELAEFGLRDVANVHPRELSSGQRQRVGLARAFVSNPKVIFIDEPFSELDSFTARKLQEELIRIWQERKPTIVMVSNNIQEALLLADRIAVVSHRPAKVRKIIPNDLPRPRNPRSEKFFSLEDQLSDLIRP